jgi:hypothetical protein
MVITLQQEREWRQIGCAQGPFMKLDVVLQVEAEVGVEAEAIPT